MSDQFENAVLILASTQLGLKSIPVDYHQTILECMKIPQFVGAVGGRPKLAHYFVGGIQSSNNDAGLIYLDPHLVQSTTHDIKKEYMTNPTKFHYDQARVLNLHSLDPSLSFGFLIQKYEDFVSLQDHLCKINKDLPEELKVLTIQGQNRED